MIGGLMERAISVAHPDAQFKVGETTTEGKEDDLNFCV